MKQIELSKQHFGAKARSYGGTLLKTRKGRSGPRPITTRESMHLVLRSSKATEEWSFKTPKNAAKVKAILKRFSSKYAVKVFSFANVGNHLHLHIRLTNRFTYKPFIRAFTSAIAMAVTGASRWTPLKTKASDRFWDYRPFTRMVQGFRAFLNLKDYIQINRFEAQGQNRTQARLTLAWRMDLKARVT